MPSANWDQIFVFTVSPFELFVRGTLIYLLIFVLMRILRREPGTVGIADLLMVVLVADASQNAMAGEYRSVLDGGHTSVIPVEDDGERQDTPPRPKAV